MYDFGLGLSGASTEAFRRDLVHRCQGRFLSSVAREYGITYTTLEHWFYEYAPDELVEEEATVVSVDEFQQYATSLLNVHTGRILAIVPHRNETAIAVAQLQGTMTTVVSDFVPAMAKAIRSVFSDATHILDHFHLVQFFTEAIRRRRYLGESKKHIHVRIIDRCLSIAATILTEEKRSIILRCTTEDEVMGMMYRALQHIRYVLK